MSSDIHPAELTPEPGAIRRMIRSATASCATWWRRWVGVVVFLFIVQLLTGAALMTVYSPSVATAWGSVWYLQTKVPGGWLVRGIHHFASDAMLIVLGSQLVFMILAGSYRSPRAAVWVASLVLVAVVLAASLTGELLPWDQAGFWGTQVRTNILARTPLVGGWLRRLLIGGDEFGHLTLTRFYTLHVLVLPGIAGVLLWFRRAAALRAATAAPVLDTPNAETAGSPSDADGPPHRRHIAIGQVIVFLAVVAVVWYVERYRGATLLDAPADPTASDYPARPEWHTLFLYQWLKNFSGPSMEVVGAIVLPTLAGVVFLAYPWFDRVVHRHVARALTLLVTVGLLAGIGRLTATALRADADPSDAAVAASRERQAGGTGLTQRDEAVLRARRFNRQRGRAERVAARAMVLAERHGIPPEGPLTLLAADPAIQGPVLFAGHCASCHRFDGHDGLGDLPSEAATSSDLYGYGTRGWIRGLLTDPMADRFFGRMKKPDGQAAHTRMSRLVADTLEENEDPADRRKLLADLDAVAAYLEDEGRRPGRLREILPPDDVDEEDDLDSDDEASDSVEPATEPPDGRTEDGALGSSSTVALSDAGDDEALILRGRHYFMSVCNECHSYDEERSGTLRAPEMLGYASVEWVELMIRNPSHDLRYRSRGREPAQMPSFADRLTGPQRLLIARWLVGSDEATVSVPAEGGLP